MTDPRGAHDVFGEVVLLADTDLEIQETVHFAEAVLGGDTDFQVDGAVLSVPSGRGSNLTRLQPQKAAIAAGTLLPLQNYRR